MSGLQLPRFDASIAAPETPPEAPPAPAPSPVLKTLQAVAPAAAQFAGLDGGDLSAIGQAAIGQASTDQAATAPRPADSPSSGAAATPPATPPVAGFTTGPIMGDLEQQDQPPSVPFGAFEGQDWFGLSRQLIRWNENQTALYGRTANDGVQIIAPEPRISAEDANAKYGIEDPTSPLRFTNPVPESVAKSMYDAKRDELNRRAIAALSPQTFTNGVERFGAGFASNALDPLNIAAAFIPVVGEARYADWLATAGGPLARAAIRGGVGAAQGVVGQAPLSLLRYGLSRQEEADYSATDAMLDVAYGGLLGGGLHAAGGAIGDALTGRFRRAPGGPQRGEDMPGTETAASPEPPLPGGPALDGEATGTPEAATGATEDDILRDFARRNSGAAGGDGAAGTAIEPADARGLTIPEEAGQARRQDIAEPIIDEAGSVSPRPSAEPPPQPSAQASPADQARDRARQRDQARQARAAEQRAAAEQAAATASPTPAALGEDGRFPVDARGYVLSPDGEPVAFHTAKQGAKWIVDQGHAKSADQVFELSNHPDQQGMFTARERARVAPAAKPAEGEDALTERFTASPAGALAGEDLATREAALRTSLAQLGSERPVEVQPVFDARLAAKDATAAPAEAPSSPAAIDGALAPSGMPLFADEPSEQAEPRNAQAAENSATAAGNSGEPTPPPAEPRSAPAGAAFVMLDPAELTLDPKRFQYKKADAAGVTGALAGAKRWEATLANPITAWRANDGKLYVVNGHQRTDWARRAVAAGQEGVQIPARIFDEKDGYTADFMRALGAYQNIAEGSGTAIDAAKVLRGQHAIPKDRELPGLPPKSQLVEQARGLAALDEHAFGMVVNEIVPAAYAAEVGRAISDPAEQLAALRVLAKAEPANLEQARIIVEDIRNSGFLKGEQASLFGTESTAESLFAERSRILENAGRSLARLKGTFNTAVEHETTLAEAGNVMARGANLEGKARNEALQAILRTDGTRRGPISDALSDAARELKSGKSLAAVTRDFLARARDIAADRADAGGGDRTNAGAAAGASAGSDAGLRPGAGNGGDGFAPAEGGEPRGGEGARAGDVTGQGNLFGGPLEAAASRALDAASGKRGPELDAISKAADRAAQADRGLDRTRDLAALEQQTADLLADIQRAQAGGELPNDIPELDAADRQVDQAGRLGRAYEQAATCIAMGGLL